MDHSSQLRQSRQVVTGVPAYQPDEANFSLKAPSFGDFNLGSADVSIHYKMLDSYTYMSPQVFIISLEKKHSTCCCYFEK